MNIKILLILALSIFLINNVSAVISVYGDWENGAQNIQITQGESVDFNSDFFSMNPPMTINIKLYDSNYNLVHAFENNKIVRENCEGGAACYYHTYTITEQIYETTGNFELVLSGSDVYPDSDSHTLYLRVVEGPEPNQPPRAYSTTTTTNEDTTASLTLLASDPNGDELTYTIVSQPQHGTLTGSGHSRTYSPDENWYGTNSFTFKVYDGEYYSNTATVTIIVKPINDAPIITSTPVTRVDEGKSYTYQVTAQDVENDKLYYTLTQAPNWLSINSQTGLITGTAPLVHNDKTFPISVKVLDASTFDTQSYNLIVKDISEEDTTPPEITIISPQDKEYDYSDILFKIRTNEATESAWFVLDGGDEIRMNKLDRMNFEKTLEVEDGQHEVVFYAKDLAGNIGRKSIQFSVDTEDDEEDDKEGRNIGVRYLPYDNFYESKYWDQFAPPRVIYEEVEKEIPSEEKSNLIWLIVSFLLLIAILIILIILVLYRRGR